jgi:hypothetical protein
MGRNKMIYATELPELSMSGVVTKSDIGLSPTFESNLIHTPMGLFFVSLTVHKRPGPIELWVPILLFLGEFIKQ